MLDFPKAPRQSDLGFALAPSIRVTPMGEMMAAAAGNAWEMITVGQVIENSNLPGPPVADDLLSPIGQRAPEEPPMTQEEYQQSEFFRENVKYDQRMTPARAEAISEIVDRREYRKALLERAPGGIGSGILKLGAALGTTALDPINYVPILGPAARAVAVARMGRIAGTASIAGAEAAIATAATEPFIAQSLATKGETLTSSDIAFDIALAFGIGSAFGGAVGTFARGMEQRQAARLLRKDGVEPALDALASAAEDLRADNPVDVGRYFDAESRFRQRVLGETSLSNFSEARAQINRLPTREPLPAGLVRPVPTPVEVRGLTRPTEPGQPTRVLDLNRPIEIPIRDKQNRIVRFKNETKANKRARELGATVTKEGDRFTLRKSIGGDLVRKSDGTPQTFTSERAAQRFARQQRIINAGIVRLPIKDGKQQFALTKGMSASDIAAINSDVDNVVIPARPDRSAGARSRQPIRSSHAKLVRNEDGSVLEFSSLSDAQLIIDQSELRGVRAVRLTSVGEGAPRYGILRDEPPRNKAEAQQIRAANSRAMEDSIRDFLGKPKEQRQLNMGIEAPYVRPVQNVQAAKAIDGRTTSRTRELPPEETLDEFEINEVEQLRQQGALDDVDEAIIREADDNVAKAENYDVAYQSLATCITRFAA